MFSMLDWAALAFFVSAWLGYHWAVELTPAGRKGLNGLMNEQRRAWMERMRTRELRIVDTTIMASLQNGTAFFASTSLIAVGGSLALLRSADDAVALLSIAPGGGTTRLVWELKVVGLAVIFVYAFFKFSWSYRLFNYAAILIGVVPMPGQGEEAAGRAAAARAADMLVAAGRHFNTGQRAFFFSLAYLGWFLGPIVLFASTTAVILVMWRRQFASTARDAVLDTHGDPPP